MDQGLTRTDQRRFIDHKLMLLAVSVSVTGNQLSVQQPGNTQSVRIRQAHNKSLKPNRLRRVASYDWCYCTIDHHCIRMIRYEEGILVVARTSCKLFTSCPMAVSSGFREVASGEKGWMDGQPLVSEEYAGTCVLAVHSVASKAGRQLRFQLAQPPSGRLLS